MNDAERMRVLEMLEQGKITAAEAAELLKALGGSERESGRRSRTGWTDGERDRTRQRWFKVRVTDTATGDVRTDFAVPITAFNLGMGFAHKFRGISVGNKLDDIIDAVRTGRRGTIYDVTSDECGQRIEIIID